MSSKQQILDALRAAELPDVALPPLDRSWTTYADPNRTFRTVLEAAGGRVLEAGDPSQVGTELEQLETFRQAERVWSLVPEVASRGGDWDAVQDPHDLETLDFCVVPGEFCVAENGAVWISNETIRHRAGLLIAQHLALVVPADRMVHNMHEAYGRIELESLHFGVFISGPSKTADIEQSLVIGAHGPRSLSVVLVGRA